jgi:hypothetical protein
VSDRDVPTDPAAESARLAAVRREAADTSARAWLRKARKLLAEKEKPTDADDSTA